jgi:hypothetical protein
MNNRLLALFVWIAAEAVLQIHGIQFWQQHGGWNGWLWSVVLCVATVWFWLHHNKSIRYTFGIVASALLLAGPLWQVGAPLVDATLQRYEQQRYTTLQLVTLRNVAVQQSATLQTFLRNSEARTGWAPMIVRVQENLAATRRQITEVATAPPVARAGFLSIAVIVIQLTALIVLQVAAVAALLVIRKAPEVKPAEEPEPVATKSRETSPTDIDGIKQRISSGHYGEKPSMRQVITGEGLRHREVRSIFHDLVAMGVLVKVGERFKLEANH